jgi:hypothetical protein
MTAAAPINSVIDVNSECAGAFKGNGPRFCTLSRNPKNLLEINDFLRIA